MLNSQAPNYCTAQRFNLFLATTLSTKAPMPGVALVSACKGSPVNPFVLGFIACELSNEWSDREKLEYNDYFNDGAIYSSIDESIAYALKKAVGLSGVDLYPGLEDNGAKKVEARYLKFVRFCQKMEGSAGGNKTPVKPKLEPISIPTPLPLPIPIIEKLANPPVAPQPEKPAEKEKVILPVPNVPNVPKWKTKTKIVLGGISAAITMAAIFIPDYIEVPLRLLIKLISEIISF